MSPSTPGASWARARASLLLVAVSGILVMAGCAPDAPYEHGPTGRGSSSAPAAGTVPDPAAYAAGLLAATQAVRDEEGVPRLEESDCASEAARTRAAALVGVPLEHAPLDDVVTTCSPPAGTAAENLSRAAAEPAAVVDAWMASHGHRANLLDPALTAVGVACVPDPSEGAGGLVCAQVFLG